MAGKAGNILKTVIAIVLVFLLTKLFVSMFPFVRITGVSMEPTYADGDYVRCERYNNRELERGEVVVFKHSDVPFDSYVKRVIALPGETVMLKDGYFYVDGERLDDIRTDSYQMMSEGEEVTVGDNAYFVVGDNRNKSTDSRTFGCVSGDKIKFIVSED